MATESVVMSNVHQQNRAPGFFPANTGQPQCSSPPSFARPSSPAPGVGPNSPPSPPHSLHWPRKTPWWSLLVSASFGSNGTPKPPPQSAGSLAGQSCSPSAVCAPHRLAIHRHRFPRPRRRRLFRARHRHQRKEPPALHPLPDRQRLRSHFKLARHITLGHGNASPPGAGRCGFCLPCRPPRESSSSTPVSTPASRCAPPRPPAKITAAPLKSRLSSWSAAAAVAVVFHRDIVALALVIAAAGYAYDLHRQRNAEALQLPLKSVGQQALALSSLYAILLIIGLW